MCWSATLAVKEQVVGPEPVEEVLEGDNALRVGQLPRDCRHLRSRHVCDGLTNPGECLFPRGLDERVAIAGDRVSPPKQKQKQGRTGTTRSLDAISRGPSGLMAERPARTESEAS